MPRKARIDAPGALQYIIVKGIERRKKLTKKSFQPQRCDGVIELKSRILQFSQRW